MSEQPEDLITKAATARREHRLEDAALAYAAAAERSRSNHSMLNLTLALSGQGQIARDQGRLELAQQFYAEALDTAREHDDPLIVAHTARHLGDLYREQRLLKQAEPLLTEAIDLYRANMQTKVLDLANAIRPLALLKTEANDVHAAKALWLETQMLYASIHISAGVAECADQLARLP
jgi:tetratricopeptide (TPR) repeat protein